VTAEQAPVAAPVVLVTGTFDVLRAEHARELSAVRKRCGAVSVVAAVLPGGPEWLSAQARAELVAAMHMVDYVVIAAGREAEDWIALLRPVEVVRLEAGDARRVRELIEHVERRQTK
jgi:bifunctional ADP-heptose synthase (sugar kinase/adenylyltransferase)